ncbi:MAG: cupin domain-containing protein [Deltaproteobacteria bacterium]|nr:cupin domain-containing protein [Deltaproteobacteria bacterium]
MKKQSEEKHIPRHLSLKEWEKGSKERKKRVALIKNLFDFSGLENRGPSYCTEEGIKEQKRLLKNGLGNIYNYSRIPKEGETFDVLQKHKNVKIERIVSSYKVPNKVYVQKQDEWVVLLKGQAKLNMEGKIIELKEGDFLFIKSGRKHKVLKTEHGAMWLGVHIF